MLTQHLMQQKHREWVVSLMRNGKYWLREKMSPLGTVNKSKSTSGFKRNRMDKQETRFQPEPSSQSLVSLLSMNNSDFDLSLCAPFTKIARIIICKGYYPTPVRKSAHN